MRPPLSARYLINNKNSLKTSYSGTNQYIQLASNSTTGTPLDVWFPASEYVKPQICDQVSAGRDYDKGQH
ncbi:MAG: hypothetical protein R6U46_13655 [Marinilabilia sp.]